MFGRALVTKAVQQIVMKILVIMILMVALMITIQPKNHCQEIMMIFGRIAVQTLGQVSRIEQGGQKKVLVKMLTIIVLRTMEMGIGIGLGRQEVDLMVLGIGDL
jgi:hypothetical protein